MTEGKENHVLLHVIPVKVSTKDGNSVTTYGLLDNASRGTIVDANLAKRLNVKGIKQTVAVTTVLGTQNCEFESVCLSLQAAAARDSDPVLEVKEGLVRELNINERVLPNEIDCQGYQHLADIIMPEVELKQVSIIIGEDVKRAHIVQEVRVSEFSEDELYATRTALGWSIAGSVKVNSVPKGELSVNFLDTNDQTLNRQLQRFWEMEIFGLKEADLAKTASVEDHRAENILQRSTKLVEGHYETELLWKSDCPQLPNNRTVAEKRLKSLKKRFNNSPELETKYRKVMEEYIEKGFARKLTEKEAETTTKKTNYLPHHHVVNRNKPGKVRVVFDAAAKFEDTSLNQNLLQGPDYTNSLVGVMIRFREDSVALVADIEGMFNQVKVSPEDQDAFRFLWWSGSLEEPPDEYVMTVHVFGATDSPCCANYCLKRTAEDNKDEYDISVVETVRRHFYVDDMLRALKNEEIAIEVAKGSMDLLSRGGFRLTKFLSNSRTVLQAIPVEKRALPDLDLDLDQLPIERTLGVHWNVEDDMFCFKIKLCDKPNTKRGVLSCVSSFYDPMGFAAPVVLPVKQILQVCWRKKLKWDDSLDDDLLRSWTHWKSLLPLMTQISIPRCFYRLPDHDDAVVELHHFCDASEIGYGTVSYLRVIYSDGTVSCSFVMGKSRNAPIRAHTIPRLELQSALLAVRMNNMIQRELDITVHETFFWTDSMIVLSYIGNTTKRFQTYVANRVKEIRESSEPTQWRHCPGNLNPADDCSRGLDPQKYVEQERWLRGPEFLWNPRDSWPDQQIEEIPDTELEIKKERITCTTSLESTVNPLFLQLLERYSDWSKLLKSVAWLSKFKIWLRNGKRTVEYKGLTVEDLDSAKRTIISLVQRLSFPDELRDLKGKSQACAKKSSSIVKLKPMLSKDGILRVSGRISEAPTTFDSKHQMILPQNHHVTTLIIRFYHQQLGHCGQEQLLSRLREEFWIIKGRATIKREINKCIPCRKRYSERMTQEMAELPKVRLTPFEPPFTNTGVDFFGPLMVKHGRGSAKRYGCIFVCMASRAIHLELAQSLETGDFIMALRRFLNIRGNVKQLRSDNGTNFVGAERELREALENWNQHQIEEHLVQRGIEWIFHPPYASHMSGVWERLIRGVKRSLKAILGRNVVKEEVLRTVLSEAQGIANSRPLCPNSDDPRDMEPLTPSHLLLQRPAINLPTGNFDEADLYSRKTWRQSQVLSDHFWKRWLHEYLPTLQQRQKWLRPQRNLAINDLVILVDENVPRGHWLLGRVTKVFPGRDGLVRVAEVKTKTNIFKRPISKLCFLEAAE